MNNLQRNNQFGFFGQYDELEKKLKVFLCFSDIMEFSEKKNRAYFSFYGTKKYRIFRG